VINVYRPDPRTIEKYVNTQYAGSGGPPKNRRILPLGLVALLTVTSFSNISCNKPTCPEISDKIVISELTPEEAKILQDWESKGKPNLFKVLPKGIELCFKKQGYDTENLTPELVLKLYPIMKDYGTMIQSLK
jgi:hypothetical protein